MSPDAVTVVVPTYNERENLPRLVARLADVLEDDWSLVVVDDASPDGTADVAAELSRLHPVAVLRRPGKLGLGSAYRDGFRASPPGLVVAMDGDLSHDPRHVPALVAAVRDGADLALGSRYVAGGRIHGWGLRRKATSRGANLLARAVLGLGVRDATTGFRCYGPKARAAALAAASDGYAFQIETLHLAKRRGLVTREVPIEFRDRDAGASKLGAREVVQFLATLRRLRFGEPRVVRRVRTPTP